MESEDIYAALKEEVASEGVKEECAPQSCPACVVRWRGRSVRPFGGWYRLLLLLGPIAFLAATDRAEDDSPPPWVYSIEASWSRLMLVINLLTRCTLAQT